MYNVMLVDDECSVTDALCRGINWESLGLKVAAVAKSGNQALKLLETAPFDIVISDIRMTDLDGLSMVRKLVRQNSNIQVILISGFAEFSYAQEALSYGVLAYVLKPVDYQELQTHLHTAIARIRQTTMKTRFTELISMLYAKDDKQLQTYLSSQGIRSDAYYLGASVGQEPLFTQQNMVLKIPLSMDSYGYISSSPLYYPNFTANLQKKKYKGFAYSQERVPLKKVSSSLKHLHYYAYCFFFTPSVKIISDAGGPDPADCLQTLDSLTKSSNCTALLQYLEKRFTAPAEFHSLETAWKIYNILANSSIYGDFIVEDAIYSPEQLVYHYGSFTNMLSSFQACLRCISTISLDSNEFSNAMLLRIVKYINQHLSNCTLAQLAADMGMSPNHLSHFFKVKMGKTYTTYVTELKIAKAQELIDTSTNSLYEIASQLGFNDYFYFLKTFKKITGVTPSQYAEKNS